MNKTELTSETIEQEIKNLLHYNSFLQQDNKILREDRELQKKAQEAFEKHSQLVLDQINKQTIIFENLLITLNSYFNRNL